jgi:Xaa-Pro aminopeptidase
VQRALEKMDAAMRAFTFTDPRIRDAAQRFVDVYRNRQAVTSLGHWVGMEVHDVGGPAPTLEPGMIFTIEPAMTLPHEHIGVRLEDMILITSDGYENLSAFVPVEIADIEKTMAEPGLHAGR